MIKMPRATSSALTQDGYSLYGFQVVVTSNKATAPMAWLAWDQFQQGDTLGIAWGQRYVAYVSPPDRTTDVISSIEVPLGKSATVDEDGELAVVDGGTPGAISIRNRSDRPYGAGIMSGPPLPQRQICGQPLFGNMLDVIAPIDKMLFMFATNAIGPGVPVLQAYSQAILIDFLDGARHNVEFDIDKGWSWKGEPWAVAVGAEQSLVTLLINRTMPE